MNSTFVMRTIKGKMYKCDVFEHFYDEGDKIVFSINGLPQDSSYRLEMNYGDYITSKVEIKLFIESVCAYHHVYTHSNFSDFEKAYEELLKETELVTRKIKRDCKIDNILK